MLLILLILVFIIYDKYLYPNVKKLPTPLKNKKVALCVSGQIREGLEECYNTWVKKLDMDNIDVFSCVEGDDNKINRLKTLLNPKKILVVKKNLNEFDYINSELSNTSISMFYKIYKANQLKTEYEKYNKFKYDVVIRIRPDLKLLSDIPIHKIFTNNVMYIPYLGPRYVNVFNLLSQNPFGVSDQFSFGSSEMMDKYSNIYVDIENGNMSSINNFTPEVQLLKYLNKRNINYKQYNQKLYIYNFHKKMFKKIYQLDKYKKMFKKSFLL